MEGEGLERVTEEGKKQTLIDTFIWPDGPKGPQLEYPAWRVFFLHPGPAQHSKTSHMGDWGWLTRPENFFFVPNRLVEDEQSKGVVLLSRQQRIQIDRK